MADALRAQAEGECRAYAQHVRVCDEQIHMILDHLEFVVSNIVSQVGGDVHSVKLNKYWFDDDRDDDDRVWPALDFHWKIGHEYVRLRMYGDNQIGHDINLQVDRMHERGIRHRWLSTKIFCSAQYFMRHPDRVLEYVNRQVSVATSEHAMLLRQRNWEDHRSNDEYVTSESESSGCGDSEAESEDLDDNLEEADDDSEDADDDSERAKRRRVDE